MREKSEVRYLFWLHIGMKALFLAIVTAIFARCLSAQSTSAQELGATVRDQVRSYRHAHEREILGEFVRLLSIPNLASDPPKLERNAQAIAANLEGRGVDVKLLRVPGAPPVVYGWLRVPGARSTIGIYAHYDGQPVEAQQWQSSPFSPGLRDAAGHTIDWQSMTHYDGESRIYARSAGDDKAPIQATMSALDALRSLKEPLSVNVKSLKNGEEEVGSSHLPEILNNHPDTLAADIWLLCDGPLPPSRRMQVFFGTRGETDVEITVYGAAREMHSGNYGNWAPNPIVLLTHLLDSMRDTDAKILISGFYEDVRALAPSEQEALANFAASDEALKQEFAIAAPEGNGASLAEQLLKPALNVRGIRATDARVRQQVETHIERQGFFIVHQNPDIAIRRAHARVVKLEWTFAGQAFRTAMDNPAAQAIVKAIEQAKGLLSSRR